MDWIHTSDPPDDEDYHTVCYGRGSKDGCLDLRAKTLFVGNARYINGQWRLHLSPGWFEPIVLFWMPKPTPPMTPKEYYAEYK